MYTKYTFLKARHESPPQSVDESMTKFKGRSRLKQYLPLKLIKRGIKVWTRCDSLIGIECQSTSPDQLKTC
ncbi:hypothetical protein NQ318_020395 [Aromia moschata]|uniref:PiggyBac transposable element-derived protein domain-containing protein n=1 Tax=Aromia moschata TaxID=1265417 RepID=A0AAV8Y450_9CUCU|nr:hypothetical protein NQ318_020395 [Aromia moschata]